MWLRELQKFLRVLMCTVSCAPLLPYSRGRETPAYSHLCADPGPAFRSARTRALVTDAAREEAFTHCAHCMPGTARVSSAERLTHAAHGGLHAPRWPPTAPAAGRALQQVRRPRLEIGTTLGPSWSNTPAKRPRLASSSGRGDAG